MANLKVCRVCGKEYEPCRSLRQVSSVFNWRAVACSPQCGQEYFRQVEESRSKSVEDESAEQHSQDIDSANVEVNEVFDEHTEIETFF